MGLRHKSTEGFGLDDVRREDHSADELIDTKSDHDEASKIIKVAIGGVAAGALMAGIYELARHRLNKSKEQ